jgi:pyroglutamyl-peptidase
MVQPSILITGFGPFPGAPENPSAWLVERLASTGISELHAEVLPAEWEPVTRFANRFHETLQPRVMIHFGLSQRARGFRLEQSAHNRIVPRADATDAFPSSRLIRSEGHDRLDSSFPAKRLAAHLRHNRLPVASSRSAGRYLCNFLYYLSLDWAARQTSPCHVLFVHIPPEETQGGPLRRTELLRGGESILRFALDVAANAASTSKLRATAAHVARA